MIIVNFKVKVPYFGIPKHDEKAITTKNPYEIFSEQRKSKGSIMLDMRCCCNDSSCKSNITFYYSGLDRYTSSKNLASDTEVNILPYHEEKKGRASNVLWNPTIENVAQFISFLETTREAIAFKQELLGGLYAELQIRIKGYDEILIVVRKDESGIRFILFEIPVTFPKVPLLCESKDYFECLGVIATLPANMDTSKIKNDYADINNPFFEPVISWVKLLGQENQLDLSISNIWVMPE